MVREFSRSVFDAVRSFECGLSVSFHAVCV